MHLLKCIDMQGSKLNLNLIFNLNFTTSIKSLMFGKLHKIGSFISLNFSEMSLLMHFPQERSSFKHAKGGVFNFFEYPYHEKVIK